MIANPQVNQIAYRIGLDQDCREVVCVVSLFRLLPRETESGYDCVVQSGSFRTYSKLNELYPTLNDIVKQINYNFTQGASRVSI